MINDDRFRVDLHDASDVDDLTTYLAALMLRSALTNDMEVFEQVGTMIRDYLTKADGDIDTTLALVQLLLVNATSNAAEFAEALHHAAPDDADAIRRGIRGNGYTALMRMARVSKPTTPEGAS